MTPNRGNTRWPRAVTGLAMVVASVILAVLSANVSYGLTQERESTCDGQIPMPVSAFVLGWTAIGLAALVVVLAIALGGGPWRGHGEATGTMGYQAGGISLAVLVLAVVAIAFDAYVLYTVYQDAPLQQFVCSG